ncbi:WD40 repeat-like protein [Delitschia confertaspora ATCC 74209]|uniref:WD40 repeat-like protein n=1 Tax=Delitschia confertaspora ATCC 74209 TaxID=1513339 RepID=A0A9P4JEG0_9PLEO|nr:WD40 repeat-like protein [Delitschia confertaspora ATCC 74209]
MTETVEPLSSNVVNYLVWRYLQEAGYRNAALQLSRSWIRDPESLPFAKNITPQTLIRILQDGLWLDKLQAETGHGQKRYRFGTDHGVPYSANHGELLQAHADEEIPVPRPQIEEETNGAVTDPAPRKGTARRKRKVNGVEPRTDVHTNGDVMEIDINGHTHVTNSVRGGSETAISEAESSNVEIPISTLSIGQSTEIQTEKPPKAVDLDESITFLTSTMRNQKSSQPWGSVDHILWGPPGSKLLLTAGNSLLRIMQLPTHTSNGISDGDMTSKPLALDVPFPLSDFRVTAVCWTSRLSLALATEEKCPNELGQGTSVNKLWKLADGGRDIRLLASVGETITALRWNESTKSLLMIAMSAMDVGGRDGSIKIWKEEEQDPAWEAFTESAILDAAWMGDASIIVSGVDYLEIFEIGDTLKPQRSFETSETWDKVKYDPLSGIISCLSTAEQEKGFLGVIHPNEPTRLQVLDYPDIYLSDFDVQPRPNSNSASPHAPVLLAAGSMSGVARLYDANEPFKCLKIFNTGARHQINAVAFSPDGSLLATAGCDAVTVWSLDHSEVPKAVWFCKDLSDDWDFTVVAEINLGWDPDGSRLSVTLADQIAVIDIPR